MTDSEIIRALERCVKTEFISDCAKCEMLAFDCKDTLIEYALDLIKRQKAEIEEEKQAYSRLADCYAIEGEETERIRQRLYSYENMFLELGFSLAEVKDIDLKEIRAWKDRMIWHCKRADELFAEIKKLKQENEILSKNADTAFQDGLNEAQDLYALQIKNEIKSEAVREFAERLKEKAYPFPCAIGVENAVTIRTIDDLAKEMVGEDRKEAEKALAERGNKCTQQ